eukprot:1771770-Rhodomonas_salina.5
MGCALAIMLWSDDADTNDGHDDKSAAGFDNVVIARTWGRFRQRAAGIHHSPPASRPIREQEQEQEQEQYRDREKGRARARREQVRMRAREQGSKGASMSFRRRKKKKTSKEKNKITKKKKKNKRGNEGERQHGADEVKAAGATGEGSV